MEKSPSPHWQGGFRQPSRRQPFLPAPTLPCGSLSVKCKVLVLFIYRRQPASAIRSDICTRSMSIPRDLCSLREHSRTLSIEPVLQYKAISYFMFSTRIFISVCVAAWYFSMRDRIDLLDAFVWGWQIFRHGAAEVLDRFPDPIGTISARSRKWSETIFPAWLQDAIARSENNILLESVRND